MPVSSSNESIRREIAGLAARLVADAGLDYGAAKRKAAGKRVRVTFIARAAKAEAAKARAVLKVKR